MTRWFQAVFPAQAGMTSNNALFSLCRTIDVLLQADPVPSSPLRSTSMTLNHIPGCTGMTGNKSSLFSLPDFRCSSVT
jgi:hypothetical protein